MFDDFLINQLKGGQSEEVIENVLGQIEPNGVLKILNACLVSIQDAEEFLFRLDQVKLTISYMLNSSLLIRLYENLLMLSTLTYEGF